MAILELCSALIVHDFSPTIQLIHVAVHIIFFGGLPGSIRPHARLGKQVTKATRSGPLDWIPTDERIRRVREEKETSRKRGTDMIW